MRFTDAPRSIQRCYYGPGSVLGEDSLAQDWRALKGNCWINPEFGEIKHYAAKCARSKGIGRRILLLVPASVGSNWWAEHVDRKALVLFTSPRVKFVGHVQSYPKDLALCCYATDLKPGYECWRWDGKEKPV